MIRAWRYWRVGQANGHSPRLWSLFVGYQWDGPHVIADYLPRFPDNGHGIYGFKTSQGAYYDFVEPLPGIIACVGVVSGWVQLWGKIVEHDDGYRAEHALIESLYNRTNKLELMSALQHHYGVDLI